jgi:hypothetical protein
MATNLYQDLKDLLQDFKDFLDPKIAVLKPAVRALAALIPQVDVLLDSLTDVLQDVKTAIHNLDVSAIPLGEVTAFTSHVRDFLASAKSLLPDQADDIDAVLRTVDVVGGLPSIDQVRTEIENLIDDLVADVNQLKAA